MPSTNSTPIALSQLAVLLNPEDDVAIARTDLAAGTTFVPDAAALSTPAVTILQPIPAGHKIALNPLSKGTPVHRYGQVIGFASQQITPGDHIHTHNLEMADFERRVPPDSTISAVSPIPVDQRRTFRGYRRPDGRVGTRNHLAVVSTVNCSAHATQAIAHHFSPDRLTDYPNINGVIAFTHASGCDLHYGGADFALIQRTLAGIACHPNVGAALLVGLGCETIQIPELLAAHDLETNANGRLGSLIIQEVGGIRKTVEAGISFVTDTLPALNQVEPVECPLSDLKVALQCGGSDGWSGVTANPLLGEVSNELVRQGGTVVLAETPEIFGAEHLLARRAINGQVAQQLLDKITWWDQHSQQHGMGLDSNRSPGNEAGGLTTIYEKSLGAIAKGGSAPLMAVYDYAESITARGLTFMDSPGNDPVSVTGQLAGGCNLVLFSTGRGSVFGSIPAPTVKICSNPVTFSRMSEDMDFNAGALLENGNMQTAAADLLDLVVSVASGQPSKSESLGVGEGEFTPWQLGGTL